MNTIGGSKLFNPRPPAKGSFPIDHFGECKDVMNKYMACLQKSGQNASECHLLAKDYLNCRMENDLMAKEDMKYLGFKDDAASTPTKSSPSETTDGTGKKLT